MTQLRLKVLPTKSDLVKTDIILSGHPLFNDLPLSTLVDLVKTNPNLHGYIQGYLAEAHLKAQLEALPGVESVTKIPDSSEEKGDLLVVYKGVPLSLEVKSVASNSVKEELLHGGWSGVIRCKSSDKKTYEVEGREVTSTHLIKGLFDGLAVCTFNATETWEFFFMTAHSLPEPDGVAGVVKTQFRVNPVIESEVYLDAQRFLDHLYTLKSAHDDLHGQRNRQWIDSVLHLQRDRYESLDRESHL